LGTTSNQVGKQTCRKQYVKAVAKYAKYVGYNVLINQTSHLIIKDLTVQPWIHVSSILEKIDV